MRKVQERAQALGSTSSSNTTKAFTYEPMEYFAKGFYDVKEDAVIGEMQLLKRYVLLSLFPFYHLTLTSDWASI